MKLCVCGIIYLRYNSSIYSKIDLKDSLLEHHHPQTVGSRGQSAAGLAPQPNSRRVFRLSRIPGTITSNMFQKNSRIYNRFYLMIFICTP